MAILKIALSPHLSQELTITIKFGTQMRIFIPRIRGGFKAESLLGHITRKASSPLPSPPSTTLSSLLPLSSLLLFPPLPSLRSRPPQIQLGV